MTGHDIELTLMEWAANDRHVTVMAPRCHALGHEADLLLITRGRQAHELEIKTSRADFLNEFKNKPEKYARMCGHGRTPPGEVDDEHGRRGANYFWYVVPAGLQIMDVAPKWAGVLELTPTSRGCAVRLVRDASRLHVARFPDSRLWRVAQSACLRYVRWATKGGVA